eukprot:gene15026-biopygen6241
MREVAGAQLAAEINSVTHGCCCRLSPAHTIGAPDRSICKGHRPGFPGSSKTWTPGDVFQNCLNTERDVWLFGIRYNGRRQPNTEDSSLRSAFSCVRVQLRSAFRSLRSAFRSRVPGRTGSSAQMRQAAEGAVRGTERRTQDPERRTQLNANAAEDAVFSCLRLHLSSVFGCLRPS